MDYLKENAVANCEVKATDLVKRLLGNIVNEIEGTYLVVKNPGIRLDHYELIYNAEIIDGLPLIEAVLDDPISIEPDRVKALMNNDEEVKEIRCQVTKTDSELIEQGIIKNTALYLNRLDKYLKDVKKKEQLRELYNKIN
jgi:hypothetical protein